MRALTDLVAALVRVRFIETDRARIAAAYLRVERIAMGCARALDEQ